jgi:uncharacterized damage-inducible protein DinB
MTYYGGKQLADAFRTVRGNTLKIAEEIPESQYEFKAAPECRSIGKTLTHIAVSTGIQHHIQSNKFDDMAKVNFPEVFGGIVAEEAKPRTKAEIVELLKSEGDKFAAFLESLPESFLAENVAMPAGLPGPASKTRFEMLLGPKEHEMHHRGQLMTIQRMIGQVNHLTRQFQERMAAQARATAGAGQAAR